MQLTVPAAELWCDHHPSVVREEFPRVPETEFDDDDLSPDIARRQASAIASTWSSSRSIAFAMKLAVHEPQPEQ